MKPAPLPSRKLKPSPADSGTRVVQFRLVQTRRTFEEVSAQVREMLVGGSLKPGDRLPAERDLAVLLGVGRPALREALRSLEAAGLLELRKGKSGGAFITAGRPNVVSDSMSDLLRLSNVSLQELFEARQWFQVSVIPAICERATEGDLQALTDNVLLAERLHLEGRNEERLAANIEFHNLLAQATHNPVACVMLRGLTDALRGLMKRVGTELPRGTFTYRHMLLDALKARDQAAACEALRRIIRNSELAYRRRVEQRTQEDASPQFVRRSPRATTANRKSSGL